MLLRCFLSTDSCIVFSPSGDSDNGIRVGKGFCRLMRRAIAADASSILLWIYLSAAVKERIVAVRPFK